MGPIIYVVEMLRNDTREEHSYVTGVFDSEEKAIQEATEHIIFRDGKYGAEIEGLELNTMERYYWRKLPSDIGFAASLKKTTEKLRAMIDYAESEPENIMDAYAKHPTLDTCQKPNCPDCAFASIERTVALNAKLDELGVSGNVSVKDGGDRG